MKNVQVQVDQSDLSSFPKGRVDTNRMRISNHLACRPSFSMVRLLFLTWSLPRNDQQITRLTITLFQVVIVGCISFEMPK